MGQSKNTFSSNLIYFVFMTVSMAKLDPTIISLMEKKSLFLRIVHFERMIYNPILINVIFYIYRHMSMKLLNYWLFN